MTFWDVAQAAMRWKLVTIAVLALTVNAGALVVATPGVYWGQVSVVVLLPQSSGLPNAFEATQTNAIIMAGVLVKEVDARSSAQVSSPDVTIAGQGVRRGSLVRQVNTGGQWTNNFDQPVLVVEAAGPSAQAVSRELQINVGRIRDALKRRQDAAGVPDSGRFTMAVSPTEAVIHHGNGHPTAAVLVTMLLGIGGLVSALILLEIRRIATEAAAMPSNTSFEAATASWMTRVGR